MNTQRESIRNATKDKPITVKVYVELGAKLPTRGSSESAGWDLSANLYDQESIILKPRKPLKISTGIVIDFPLECFGLLDVRSSFGVRGADLAARIIDSDYRGIIQLIVKNDGAEPIEIRHGERIAQIVFQPYTPYIQLVQVDELTDLSITGRGLSGFGSSGKY